VMKSEEGGSVGRRVLASRHNESTIKIIDPPNVSRDDLFLTIYIYIL
jgi:hypothetical protein